MAKITEIKNSIVLENSYAKISLSKKNALVEKILDKKNDRDIKNEETYFFSVVDADKETVILPTALTLDGDVITVDTPKGKMEVKATAFDNFMNAKEAVEFGICDEIRNIMQRSYFVMPANEDAVRNGYKRVREILTRLKNGKFKINSDYCEALSLATVAYIILKEVNDQ